LADTRSFRRSGVGVLDQQTLSLRSERKSDRPAGPPLSDHRPECQGRFLVSLVRRPKRMQGKGAERKATAAQARSRPSAGSRRCVLPISLGGAVSSFTWAAPLAAGAHGECCGLHLAQMLADGMTVSLRRFYCALVMSEINGNSPSRLLIRRGSARPTGLA
jgi:hypothetical protein